MVKSQAELLFVERAAELADDALDKAVSLARPGENEGRILAGMHSVVFSAGRGLSLVTSSSSGQGGMHCCVVTIVVVACWMTRTSSLWNSPVFTDVTMPASCGL